jgi:hypothetical protein
MAPASLLKPHTEDVMVIGAIAMDLAVMSASAVEGAVTGLVTVPQAEVDAEEEAVAVAEVVTEAEAGLHADITHAAAATADHARLLPGRDATAGLGPPHPGQPTTRRPAGPQHPSSPPPPRHPADPPAPRGSELLEPVPERKMEMIRALRETIKISL